MTSSRARSFSPAATASSRSRNTWSASSSTALARKRSLEPGTAWQERRGRGIWSGHPNAAATLTAPMRTVLLATLALLIAAPAASAATTVSIRVAPTETQFGSTTTITGTLAIDGVAAAGQPVTLEGRPYPYGADF